MGMGILTLLFPTCAFAKKMYSDSSVAGISFDVGNYLANLSDDDLGVTSRNSGSVEAAIDSLNEQSTTTEYPDFAGKCMATVDNSLNVRAQASGDSEIVGKMVVGSVATVLERQDAWTHIQSGNVDGFVSNDYLVYDDAAGAYAQQVCTMVAIVKADNLKVRAEQSTDSDIVARAVQGEELVLIEEDDEWAKVQKEDGTEGYVYKEYVEIQFGIKNAFTLDELASTKRTQIVAYALQFVGNPYVYGGTSLTRGTDCS